MEREPSAVTAADFDGDGEIEVHFTKGDTDWKFEAELDDDGLKVFRERDTQPAENERYSVGGAAEAKSSTNGGSLSPGQPQHEEQLERDHARDEPEDHRPRPELNGGRLGDVGPVQGPEKRPRGNLGQQ